MALHKDIPERPTFKSTRLNETVRIGYFKLPLKTRSAEYSEM